MNIDNEERAEFLTRTNAPKDWHIISDEEVRMVRYQLHELNEQLSSLRDMLNIQHGILTLPRIWP